MSESFEWAIKKDVRNNPIVREVDLERHREMWRSVGLSVFLVAVLLFTAWQQFELQQYGYRMEETQELLDEEAVINRRLRLEMEIMRSPKFVEPRAMQDLRMEIGRAHVLNSSHSQISYAVFCLKKKKK